MFVLLMQSLTKRSDRPYNRYTFHSIYIWFGDGQNKNFVINSNYLKSSAPIMEQRIIIGQTTGMRTVI